MRDRAASRALVLGVLALPFGLLAPFAIWIGLHSLSRIRSSDGELRGTGSAAGGLIAGAIGLASLVIGAAYWLLAS